MKVKIPKNHTKKDIIVLIKDGDDKIKDIYSCDRKGIDMIMKKFR